jgi:predicted DNA-binding transcriptional regulator YafY
MPKYADALFRQWHMLRVIPRHPRKIEAREIRKHLEADGFRISDRSIQRDLIELSRLFPLECDNREKPYGWYWGREAQVLDIPGMGAPEAMAFALTEKFLLTLIPGSIASRMRPYLLAANRRLNLSHKPRSGRSWTEKVQSVPATQPLLPPTVSTSVHETVTLAMLEEHQLSIVYRRRLERRTKTYCLHPLGLIQKGPVYYLTGLIDGQGDAMMFAMHRIQKAEILPDQAITPKGFSLDRLIQEGTWGFGNGRWITLEVVFQAGYGEHLYESPLSKNQSITALPKGRLRIKATLPDTQQLCWWLLGFGEGVEVIKPPHYRRWFASTAKGMAALYSS